jgi:hypothetical protein
MKRFSVISIAVTLFLIINANGTSAEEPTLTAAQWIHKGHDYAVNQNTSSDRTI